MPPKMIIGLGIIAAVGALAFFISQRNDPIPPFETNTENASQNIYDSQTNSEGAVSISVAPRIVSERILEFELTLDTHVGDLSEDLAAASVLVGPTGKEYKAVSWEGDPPGGHHRKGIIKFNSPSERLGTIVLKIRGVGGVPERIFQWTTI